MAAAKIVFEERSAPAEHENEDIATDIIEGLKDFKDGRFTRLKNADELAEHFRKL
jgi:hypothetical protein